METDVENTHVDTTREGEGGMNQEMRIDIYTLPCGNQIVGSSWLAQGAQLSAL